MSVLILNAGLAGSDGNSQVVAERCAVVLRARGVAHELLVLRDAPPGDVPAAIERAERLVLVSGTYWGGFSSLLQQLFEELTPTEGSELWLGKPAAALVTAHQVGAQSVLFRLQGVLVTLGCLIPPMSGVVISKVGEALRARAPELCDDVWGLEDVATALHNLLAAPRAPEAFRAWPVDRQHYAERWLLPDIAGSGE
ncbi:MAG TPA: NAD(P)H-dependent oxidoreductase [Polyangiaceae bacterium]|nr:NAD(P)H-dependent oxidoreductase [Polyangiaceae bacterium]